MVHAATERKFDVMPPNDADAERCVLSAMTVCNDPTLVARVRRIVWKGAFFQPDYATVFDALCDLADAETPVDVVTLRAALKDRGVFEEVGGDAGLADMLNALPAGGAYRGEHYARIVAGHARARDAIDVCYRVADRLTKPMDGKTPEAIVQAAIGRLWNIATEGRDLKIWKLGDAAERFMEKRLNGAGTVVETGVGLLDADYPGVLGLGGYTLVAARPSMGKSTFLRDLLRNRAKAGVRVGLIAVEENEDKIAGNAISAEAEVENSRVASAAWTKDEWGAIGQAVGRLAKLPFYATDSAVDLTDVLSAAEIMVTEHKCQIVAIDHIHLVSSPRSENRVQQITEISAAFKKLIKRLNVAGVVAAQLNRPEKGECPPPPHLTALRDSGALEEHADAVLMLHREDYYRRGKDNYTPNGLCNVYVRKNRNGRVGEVTMVADLKHQRFLEDGTRDPFA